MATAISTNKTIGLGDLLSDSFESDLWLFKSAQEQPDETQFAQDFANLAFQFLQDRAPALMDYILGFEVVDRAENGTRAVGIFGFKIDGDYYYVPAFFMNSQVKGVDSILAKKTNSFVPLTEEWINYIINRKANEIGSEAPKSDSTDNAADFENPNFDFLQRPTVGPLGGPKPYKTAEAEEKGWTLQDAWENMRDRAKLLLQKDAEFRKAFAGLMCSVNHRRPPFDKEAEAVEVKNYILKVGGPKAERTLLNACRNIKMANAAMEFYDGFKAFHVDSYPDHGRGCYMLRKQAQELEVKSVRITLTSDAQNEDQARDIVEDGFTVLDKRDDDHKSEVIETDYEKMFQNPDRNGVYDVLVGGGATKKAYVFSADRILHRGQAGTMFVYFPDNNQVIQARNQDIMTEGGCKDGSEVPFKEARTIPNVELHKKYIFVSKEGMALPVFTVTKVVKNVGDRPIVDGYFDYDGYQFMPNINDDFTNHWARDEWHDRNGLVKEREFHIGAIELASFKGSPKLNGGNVVLPADWKAFEVGDDFSDYEMPVASDGDKRRAKHKYTLGSLLSLSDDLRKEGAAKLDIRSDSGDDFYFSFDSGSFTGTMPYKKASVELVTRLGLDYHDAKRLLKKAAVSGNVKVLVKLGQMVGVAPNDPREQTPEQDPYTGLPVYQTPFVDESTAPFTNVELPPQDNPQGENLEGEMTRNSEGGSGGGEAEFDPEAQQLAQDAAKLGQKHVFDKAAIGGLAKVYDTGAVVDSYLPEFIQAVDRLGRVMFLYYWKHNDFIERYGTDDTIEMEDTLRNVFKMLGKLTLDLRQKAVGGGDASGSDSDIV